MSRVAMMFPGVGSQYDYMGKKLFDNYPIANDIALEASEILGVDIKHLLIEEKLNLQSESRLIQPIIITFGYITYWVIKEYINIDYYLGHSLGEITALTCAGIMKFSDAIRFAMERGEIYDKADGKGEVAIVLNIYLDELKELIAKVSKEEYITITAYNSPKQFLVAGTYKGIQHLGDLLKTSEAMYVPYRLLPMRKNVPVHSNIMKEYGYGLEYKYPLCLNNNIVISSITGQPYHSEQEIIEALGNQLFQPVLWDEAIRYLLMQGVDILIDSGPQRILKDFLVDYDTDKISEILALDIKNDMKKVLNHLI